jgi:hypothetical protein
VSTLNTVEQTMGNKPTATDVHKVALPRYVDEPPLVSKPKTTELLEEDIVPDEETLSLHDLVHKRCFNRVCALVAKTNCNVNEQVKFTLSKTDLMAMNPGETFIKKCNTVITRGILSKYTHHGLLTQ